MKGGKVDPNGIIYIGDGSWGPLISHCEANNRDLMDNNGPVHHVWKIEINDNTLQAIAVNGKGEEIDNFTKQI